MSDICTAVADGPTSLEARVAALEDRLAIMTILATYGPAVDAGDADSTAALWAVDGVYDAGIVRLEGADEIAAMVRTDPHQGFLAEGVAHVIGPPRIWIDGDRAVASAHQLVIRRDGDAHRIWRVSANRWELERTSGGWQVRRRVNRLLDGSAEGRQVFGDALADAPDA